MFWKKKTEKSEPLFEGLVDVTVLTPFFKAHGCAEFVKLLKLTRDNIIRAEMLNVKSDNDKTMFNKGQVNALNQIIANICEITKEEIVYAKRVSGNK